MSIKVRFPNDEEARRQIERDRRYWSKVYNHIEPGICPDTKQSVDVQYCTGCDFKKRIQGRDVLCALAGGWIKHN